MKFIIIQTIATVLMFSNPAGAAVTITDARLGSNSIQLDVVYPGGCKEHTFSIKKTICTRTTPMSCSYELVDHVQDDQCRAFIEKTIELPLGEEVLSGLIDQMIFVDAQKNLTVIEI